MKRVACIGMLACSMFLCSCAGTGTGLRSVPEEPVHSVTLAAVVGSPTEVSAIKDTTVKETVESEASVRRVSAPTKEEVLAARARALEGMSEDESKKLRDFIIARNLWWEQQYQIYNIFSQLSDPDCLAWNCFEETGWIQTGWLIDIDGFDGDIDAFCLRENISTEEFYQRYCKPVSTYNEYDADKVSDILQNFISAVNNENLKTDLQYLIDELQSAKNTHDMVHANNYYKALHDLDYFLFRYGPEDLAKFVKDAGTIEKFYGMTSFYT